MDVAELVATLALSINEETWKHAEELIHRVKEGAEKVGEKAEKAGEESAKGWGEFVDKLKEGLETLIGYEGIKTFTEMIEHTQETVFQTQKMAQRIGVTTQALQGLTYAAQQTDVSADSLQYGLQRLAYNVSVVGEHSEWTDQALRKIGMTQSELQAKLKGGASLDEVLSDIANKFQKMPDGATKASVAMQLFGRTAGPEMVPLLDKGSAGIESLKKEAEELGITMGDEQIEAVLENEKAMLRLQARWEGLKFTLLTELIPAVHHLISAFSRVVQFFQKHREFLYATMAGLAAAITAVGVAAAAAWWEVVKPILIIEAVVTAAVLAIEYAVEAFKGKWGVAGIVIASVASLIVGVLVAALATLTYWLYAEEIAAAIAWVATLGPIALIVAAVVALIAIIVEVVRHWDWVKEKFEDVADAIGNALSTAWHWVKDEAERVVEWIVNRLEWLVRKAKDTGKALIDLFPAVGAYHAVKGLVQGEGVGALKHLIPVYDSYHDIAGSSGGGDTSSQHVEIHNSVTIHAGGDTDTVKQIVNDTLDKSMRDAHKALKKGG